jgi:hypothetical protein
MKYIKQNAIKKIQNKINIIKKKWRPNPTWKKNDDGWNWKKIVKILKEWGLNLI